MRRSVAVLLFLAASSVSVYTWWSLSPIINLNGNAAVRYYHESLICHLRWPLVGVALSILFAATARRFWRVAAAIPFAICALVAYLIILDVHAYA